MKSVRLPDRWARPAHRALRACAGPGVQLCPARTTGPDAAEDLRTGFWRKEVEGNEGN